MIAVWLKLWSDANEQAPNQQLGMYVGVYAVLGVSGTLCMTAECWYVLSSPVILVAHEYRFLFIPIASNSALRLHNSLLRTTLR